MSIEDDFAYYRQLAAATLVAVRATDDEIRAFVTIVEAFAAVHRHVALDFRERVTRTCGPQDQDGVIADLLGLLEPGRDTW